MQFVPSRGQAQLSKSKCQGSILKGSKQVLSEDSTCSLRWLLCPCCLLSSFPGIPNPIAWSCLSQLQTARQKWESSSVMISCSLWLSPHPSAAKKPILRPLQSTFPFVAWVVEGIVQIQSIPNHSCKNYWKGQSLVGPYNSLHLGLITLHSYFCKEQSFIPQAVTCNVIRILCKQYYWKVK